MTDITAQAADPAQVGNPARQAIGAPTNATFKITDTKLYVPVVTLSLENDSKLLEQLLHNKYRSEMSKQTENKNLNHLIDQTFTKVNRLFVYSFKNEDDRISFSKYYTSNVKIKDFNVLDDGKGFFDTPIKYKAETFEAIIEVSRNNDYTTM